MESPRKALHPLAQIWLSQLVATRFQASGPRFMGGLLLGAGALFGLLLFGNILAVIFGPEPPGPGDPAPEFSAPTPDGQSRVSFASARGHVALLDFWFMACPGCVGATPKLNRLHDRYGSEGLALVSLSQDDGEERELLSFMKKRDIRYPVGVDSGGIAEAYGVYAFPTILLVDRQGKIRGRYPGPVTEVKLATQIEALLAEP